MPENSLAAFRAAIEAGAGIECDLRLSSDGAAMVFHDATLERLCGLRGTVELLDFGQLAETQLANSRECIPRLSKLLEIAGETTPLLLELKKGGGPVEPLCAIVAEEIARHAGPVGVMSFDADVGAWFAGDAPAVPRGLVIDRPPARARNRRLRTADPDFVAVSVRSVSQPWVLELRKAKLPVGCWTVRSATERQRVAVHADALIWEGDGRP